MCRFRLTVSRGTYRQLTYSLPHLQIRKGSETVKEGEVGEWRVSWGRRVERVVTVPTSGVGGVGGSETTSALLLRRGSGPRGLRRLRTRRVRGRRGHRRVRTLRRNGVLLHLEDSVRRERGGRGPRRDQEVRVLSLGLLTTCKVVSHLVMSPGRPRSVLTFVIFMSSLVHL